MTIPLVFSIELICILFELIFVRKVVFSLDVWIDRRCCEASVISNLCHLISPRHLTSHHPSRSDHQANRTLRAEHDI